MKKLGLVVLAIVVLIFLWNFFSFKILDVPPGITSDEAAFGYNATLLSKTLHDENGRFLPFFVLSLHGQDWRQPVTQYADTLTFKIFGASFLTLREVSVFFLLVSTSLLFYLSLRIKGLTFAVFSSILFLTTPILMIQAHLGLDNIAPVPFVILWLLGIYLFAEKKQFKYLVLAGVALGIGFYSYKAMRLIVPVWGILSLIYLFSLVKFNLQDKHFQKSALVFIASVLPFVLVIPLLELKYAGAVFDKQNPALNSYQSFFIGYLSNLDPSFLFISGDSTGFHSVGQYGSLLLATLPLFLIGVYQAIKLRGFFLFTLSSFLLAPLLFGTVNSLYRSSRLLALIPPYIIITALGFMVILSLKRHYKISLISLFLALILFNYGDFINYYWFTYPKLARSYFTNNSSSSYLELSKVANLKNLEPFVEKDIYVSDDTVAQFYEAAYFNQKFKLWQNPEVLPKNGVLLTNSDYLPGMKRLDIALPTYKIQVAD